MDIENQNLEVIQKPKSKRWIVIALIFIIGVGISFKSGLTLGQKGYTYQADGFRFVNQKDQPKDVDYSLLWDAIGIVSDRYIDSPVDQQKILYGAVRGAISAAGDEYTEFFNPEDLADFQTQLEGNFDGIGAEIGKRNGAVVVIAPLDDSPAQKAGLQPNDIIVSVDGQSTSDWSVDDTVHKIRGTKGTPVVLTLYREGKSDTFDVSIVRENIEVKSVKLSYKQVNDKKIAIITLSRFGNDTKALFRKAVDDIKKQSVQGLVLDLRNDPGGYLEGAIEVSSYWLGKDQLVVTEARSNKAPLAYNSYGYKDLAGLKTVVLINAGSASAAEIVAGALRDNGVARLVGEKSFGKGSVQELIELPKGGAVKVTVAKWITPSGKNLNKDGLEPDLKVELSEDDRNNKKDPQLDKALEEVLK